MGIPLAQLLLNDFLVYFEKKQDLGLFITSTMWMTSLFHSTHQGIWELSGSSSTDTILTLHCN